MNMAIDAWPDPREDSFVRSLLQSESAGTPPRPADAPSAIASVVILIEARPALLTIAEPILRSDGLDVRIVPDAARAAHVVSGDAPSCVLFLREHADESLASEVQTLRDSGCDRPIIVLCERADAESSIGLISNHAVGFIIGSEAADRLRPQIRAALSQDSDARRRAALAHTARDGVRKLTPREHEVLILLLRGMCNKDMASVLGLSVKTVETHRSRVLHKLGVESIAEFAHLLLTIVT